jgi:hypothetical protein
MKTSLTSTVNLTASTETFSPFLMSGKVTRQTTLKGQYKRLKTPNWSMTLLYNTIYKFGIVPSGHLFCRLQ